MGDMFAVGGCDCSCEGVATEPCSPCNIPAQNLVLTWPALTSGFIHFTSGTTALVWNGTNAWITACIESGTYLSNNLYFQVEFACQTGVYYITLTMFDAAGCNGAFEIYACGNDEAMGFGLGTMSLSTNTCSPFSLLFIPSGAGGSCVAPNFTITP
jgi:hypothetical protein